MKKYICTSCGEPRYSSASRDDAKCPCGGDLVQPTTLSIVRGEVRYYCPECNETHSMPQPKFTQQYGLPDRCGGRVIECPAGHRVRVDERAVQ